MESPIVPAQPQSPSSQFYDFPVFPALGQFEVRTPDPVNDFAAVEAHQYPPFDGYDESAATTYTSWLDEHMQDCVHALPQADATTGAELLDTVMGPMAQLGNNQHGVTATPAVSRDAATATIDVQPIFPSSDEQNNLVAAKEVKADVSAETNRSRRAKLPQKALDRFKLQFDIDPYPTTQEMEQLAAEENLESKTVRNWFNNARARKKPKKPVPELTTEALDAMSIISKNSDESKTSIDRYLSTAIENEGASPEAIKAALEVIPQLSSSSVRPKPSLELFVARQRSGSSPASVCSQPHSAESYGNSAGSASSYRMSAGSSMHSYGSRARRRGRRRHNYRASPYHSRPSSIAESIHGRKPLFSVGPRYSRSPKPRFSTAEFIDDEEDVPRYTCTFCGKDLKTRYEWKRHEAIHLPSKVWICCRGGVPSFSKERKFDECAAKSEAERTFHRKDHLSQHIRNCHGSQMLGSPLTWPREWEYQPPLDDKSKLVCGFCGHRCDDWNDRVSHVGDHFTKGSNFHRDWMQYSTSSAVARTATKLASRIAKAFTRPRSIKCDLPPSPPNPRPVSEALAEYDSTRQELLRAIASEPTEGSTIPSITLKGEVQCCYCHESFASYKQAMKQHSDCPSWSCLFFPGADFAFIPSGRASHKVCAYCGEIFPDNKDHVHERRDHVHNSHVKQCEGNAYTDLEAFVGHLALEHNYRAQTISPEKALSPFLMKRPAVFESFDDIK